MDVDSYFDFDSISSSSSPRTPPDTMYQTGVSDLQYQQSPRFDDKQQQPLHIYGQPSAASQAELFGSHSNPPSFPPTPDYNTSSFDLAGNSPHWAASPPTLTNAGDGQVGGAEAHNWS